MHGVVVNLEARDADPVLELRSIGHLTKGMSDGPRCQAALDAWCQSNCPHAATHQLYARYGTNAQRAPSAWRCCTAQGSHHHLASLPGL